MNTDNVSIKITSLASGIVANWLCVDDVCGSFLSWTNYASCGGIKWQIHSAFYSHDNASIFSLIFPEHKILMTTVIDSMLHHIDFMGMDAIFIPYQCGSMMDWLSQTVPLITVLDASGPRFIQVYLWAPISFLYCGLSQDIRSVHAELPETWSYRVREYNVANFRDKVSAIKVCIELSMCTNVLYSESTKTNCSSTSLDCGFGKYVNDSYNDELVKPAIPFLQNVLSSLEDESSHPHYLPLRIDRAGAADDSCRYSIILHPDYPADEPVVVGYALPYGRWFGIPFFSKDGSCKSRVLSSLELLLCYSISHR